MYINVGLIINIILWIQIFRIAVTAGVKHDPFMLYLGIAIAFIMTVWPFPVFKQKLKPEDMDDKGV